MHPHHVRIALHENAEVFAHDGVLRMVDAVKAVALAVYEAFGRIEVLGRPVARLQHPPAESDDAAADGVDGKYHPARETVVITARLALDGESRFGEELLLVAGTERRHGHRVALGRTVPQRELAHRGIRETALTEVPHSHAQPFIRIVQHMLEIVGGPTVDDHHAFAVVVPPGLLRSQLLLPHLDAVFLRHILECLGIGHLLVLHDEGHGIPALAAAETLEEPLGRRDDERRGTFAVERTACLVVRPLLLEGDEVAHHLHDVCGGIDAVHCFPVYHLVRKDYGLQIYEFSGHRLRTAGVFARTFPATVLLRH